VGASVPRKGPTLAGFVALGLFWGAWAAVLPSVQSATGSSKGALGVAMLFVALGAIPAMLLIAGPPWPTGWEDFQPNPSWPLPELPPGWDAAPTTAQKGY